MPANGETAVIGGKTNIIAEVAINLLKRSTFPMLGTAPPDSKRPKTMHGAVIISDDVSVVLSVFIPETCLTWNHNKPFA